jgi:hypothetical protein
MLSTTIGIANQVSFCIVDASRSLRYRDPEESESHVLSPQVFGDTKRDPPHPVRHSVFRQHLTSGDYLQSPASIWSCRICRDLRNASARANRVQYYYQFRYNFVLAILSGTDRASRFVRVSSEAVRTGTGTVVCNRLSVTMNIHTQTTPNFEIKS